MIHKTFSKINNAIILRGYQVQVKLNKHNLNLIKLLFQNNLIKKYNVKNNTINVFFKIPTLLFGGH